MSGGAKRPMEGRNAQDYWVAKDPDIRGVSKGRLGQHDDTRATNKNTPERVEREMNRRDRG